MCCRAAEPGGGQLAAPARPGRPGRPTTSRSWKNTSSAKASTPSRAASAAPTAGAYPASFTQRTASGAARCADGPTPPKRRVLDAAQAALVVLALLGLHPAVLILMHPWPGGGIDVPDDAVQHQPAAPPARLRAVADQLSAIAVEHHRGQHRVARAFHNPDQQAFPAGGQAW